ncbi:glutathione S-transferase 2-like [Arachis ipaensis]|uniref:glutathione S-transferase 2-like n=1 Tax=Arachis ipaensis TaxID=130454 RepID=UPI000A2B338A|nr:glutathione S-transferase 2-like [Arachis ipaensis]
MSSCSFRVRFALNLKGLKYHYVAITTSSKSDPEFLKLNPLALIPILVDGDFVLAESLAIIMVGPPTLDFNFPVSLIYSYLYSIIHVLYVAHIFLQNNIIEKKVGPYEKLPWAQSVIRKGFTGDTSLNTIKIYYVQDHLEDFNWCCRGICNPTTHSRAVPLGMNKGMNTDTIVKAKSFLDGDEDQHEKDVFEKNLKVLQNIF